MRVYINDLPPALSLETLREVVAQDTVYQELMEAVKKGKKPFYYFRVVLTRKPLQIRGVTRPRPVFHYLAPVFHGCTHNS